MININKVKRYSVKSRFSKVKSGDFAKVPFRNKSFKDFYGSLPDILKARDLRCVVEAVVKARKAKKSVIFMAGAHVIKCGLSPVIIELIKRKIITCVCLNGAGIIHDFEIAFQGKTSEDVAKSLVSGQFGMGKETADFLNYAVKEGVCQGLGLGQSVAKKISEAKLPNKRSSILYNAFIHKVPVLIFVALGTDIIHQHPSFDAASTGEGSLRDFHALVENIKGLNNGGAVLNFGSTVIMPEVFLKALNLSRNLGSTVKNFTTANFDMIYHYRPAANVVSRPVMGGGQGFYIIGHHEIMLPLLAQAIIEEAK
ncbi:MAG: deoxyhypusine synthase family protein [Candidatus Omnitrophica bacterium]|nr:deoxyhypusine synthase family protein [Candidatus Omnitrophota bacterium]MBU1869990.1 deoxyhypusine synthase family protein [Candidatus Omnitrophota bacterium]